MANELGVLSLFTGAGGLDLGLEAAGFKTRLCIENDRDALRTIKANRPSWKIADKTDVIDFAKDPLRSLRDAGIKRSSIAVLAGGPPCQPFSKAGNWTSDGPRRMRDPRAETLRAYLRVASQIRPEVLLFENVGAFAHSNNAEGTTTLTQGIARINRTHRTRYQLQLLKLNAADYGVPQLRERVFYVAHRSGTILETPNATHGPKSETESPFMSAWDAIGDLDDDTQAPDLEMQGRWSRLLSSIPEGQNYLWHTPRNSVKGGLPLFGWRTRFWSFLLKLAKHQPSWTLAASPGPATGPFHWKNRQLSVAELSRLQTFPETYRIEGTGRSVRRQIGNAVPSAIGELLGLEIRKQIFNESCARNLTLIPRRRPNCPPPETVSRVPREYLQLRAKHLDHPGAGRGPQARKA